MLTTSVDTEIDRGGRAALNASVFAQFAETLHRSFPILPEVGDVQSLAGPYSPVSRRRARAMGAALADVPHGGPGGDSMRAVVVLPSTDKGQNRTYAGRAFSMAVSDALEFDLQVGDGPAGPEGDETIYCDFPMLSEELGQRAGRALASMAAVLRGDDSEFPWGEPDPVGVGIALQVLSFLPERTKIGQGPVYRIAFHEVSPDAEGAGEGPPVPDRSDPAALSGVAGGDDRRPIKRFLSTREAADYVGLSRKTLGRWRVTSEGPRYIKRSNRVIYEVVDLDAWMEEGKRRFTAEAVGE